MELAKKILTGDVTAAANLMRYVEDDLPEAAIEMKKLYMYINRAFIIGITGAPGVGKSTLMNCLIHSFRQRQMEVGVVAIDPTSPFSGGALLGDRIRMQKHNTDKAVFIRSIASRGWSGGLARAAIGIIHILEAMGKDVVIVEAVGSGQGEVAISKAVDTTIVVLAPGLGDEIQMMKAGILETANVYVVNKADRDGAENLHVQIDAMLSLKPNTAGVWNPPVVLTQAVSGNGVQELTSALLRHKDYLESSGEIRRKRSERAMLELSGIIEHSLRAYVCRIINGDEYRALVNSMLLKKSDPYTVAEQVLTCVLGEKGKIPVNLGGRYSK